MAKKKKSKKQARKTDTAKPEDKSKGKVIDLSERMAADPGLIPPEQEPQEKPETKTKEKPSTEELLRKVEEERDAYLAAAQRERAELENYRKRVERENAQMKRASLGNFLKEFFTAFDDLDRVICEGDKAHSYETYHDGVKLVRENLWKVMKSAGVSEIDAKGKKFDPNVHEAMTAVPSAEHEPNTVMDVFETGYMLDDFVLRPARVIVSAKPPENS